jgi:hypothetical protein
MTTDLMQTLLLYLPTLREYVMSIHAGCQCLAYIIFTYPQGVCDIVYIPAELHTDSIMAVSVS